MDVQDSRLTKARRPYGCVKKERLSSGGAGPGKMGQQRVVGKHRWWH